MALDYGPTPGKKNAVTAIDNAQTTVQVRCVQRAPGCSTQFNTYNAVKVRATSDVKTFFARVVGIDTIPVKASRDGVLAVLREGRSTSCSCSTAPGRCARSRTAPTTTRSAPTSRNAKDGIKTFLGFMDPTLDHVGLAVFPPAINRNSLCVTPTARAKRYGYDTWWPEWTTGARVIRRRASTRSARSVDDYLIRTATRGCSTRPRRSCS